MGNSCCTIEKFEPGSDAAVKDFLARAANGLETTVILQDGSDLKCVLSIDTVEQKITIKCEEKYRIIFLSGIKNILSTSNQLKRIETKADLTTEQSVIGLHLLKTDSCIPIKLSDASEKVNFIAALKQYGVSTPRSSRKKTAQQQARA